MVAHHQHVEVLVDGVFGVGPRRVGGGRQHVLQSRHLDDVGGVAAAGAFGVEGVDGAALERLDGVLDEAGLVERVGVDHYLDVVVVGDGEAAVDRRRRRAPVLVQLQGAGAGLDHFLQRRRPRGVALAGKAEIHRKAVRRLDHAADVPGARRAGGGKRAVRRAGAAAEHRGDAGHQRFLDLLRADEMDVRIETAGGEDFAFAGDHLGARPDDDGDARLDIGVAGLADGKNLALLEADIRLDDPPMVENKRIGDDGVDGALGVADLALAHAVANDLAAAEFYFLAIGAEILLHLDDQIGVGEPHAVARRRPEHVGVDGTAHVCWHDVLRLKKNKQIPDIIPTAARQRAAARFCLQRARAALSSPADRLRMAPPDVRDRQDRTGFRAEAAVGIGPRADYPGSQPRTAALRT